MADEDAKKHFGPDFIQRNASLLGQYGAAPQDVSLEAGAVLAVDTIGAASLGLGIYRAGAALVRGAAAEAEAAAASTTGRVPSPRVTGQPLAGLRAQFEGVAKPGYWKQYARQIDDGVISNPFGRGEANLSRMRQGLPPVGPDGRSVPLHHIRPLSRGGTNEFENLVPFNQTTHQRFTKLLHNEPFEGARYHLQRR